MIADVGDNSLVDSVFEIVLKNLRNQPVRNTIFKERLKLTPSGDKGLNLLLAAKIRPLQLIIQTLY